MILNDICEFIVDCPHTTAPDEGVGYPLIRTPNIGKGRLNLNGVHRVSGKVYRSRIQRGAPQDDDLIFAREAPAGNVAIVKNGEKVCLGQRTVLLRPDKSKVFPDYLAYYILAPKQQYKLLGTANGATVAHVNLPVIRNMPVELPSLDAQERIAGYLSTFDDLIENNQKQIKFLEEAAQRLYKEWFVDLHFPGYKDVEIVDGVPEGWENASLRNMISFDIGGGWGEKNIKEKSEKPAYVIRGTDLYGITHGDMSSIPFRYHTESNLSSRILQEGDIVFEVSGGSKTEGVARTLLITKEMLESYGSPVICASFCKLVRINELPYSQYMYDTFQFLRSSGKTTEFDKKSASSIVNYRWKDFLAQQNILVPPHSIIDTYNCIAENLYHQIINYSKQIERLKNARDRLLPKLMSGEIEV